MPPILDQIRSLTTATKELDSLKRKLIEEFDAKGGRWQELAFIDKIAAIKLCYEKEYRKFTDGLRAAKLAVEDYLRQYGPNPNSL